jgi:MFS family permease
MAAGEVSRERDLPDERVSWSEGITAESITAENVQRFARICYGLYCLQGVVSVCGRTFIALFLKDCGLSYIEVGLFFSISAAVSTVSGLFGGIAVERSATYAHSLSAMYIFALLPFATILLQLYFYDPSTTGTPANDFLTGLFSWLQTSDPPRRAVLLTVVYSLYVICGTNYYSLTDAAVMDVMKEIPATAPYSYGKIRGTLSLGMGFMNIAIGALLTLTEIRHWQCWALSLLALVFCSFLSFPVGKFWAAVKAKRDATVAVNDIGASLLSRDQNRAHQRTWKDMIYFICNARMFVFLLVTVINGVGNATYDIYILLRLQELNASNFLIGSTAGMGSLTNFVFFLYAPRMLAFMGAHWMILLSMVAFIARASIYSIIDEHNLSLVLVAQSLHGINFSVMMVGAIAYLTDVTRGNDLTVFARSLFGFAFSGLGGILGNLLAGIVYQFFGALWVFKIKILLTLLGMILFGVSEWWHGWDGRCQSRARYTSDR